VQSEPKQSGWRGKCRHLRWSKVDFAFNPSTLAATASVVSGDFLTQEEKLELLHGFTVITQSCEDCGMARSYRTPGRAQA
jgi:hypothetical protein